jgi:hypothetical protein
VNRAAPILVLLVLMGAAGAIFTSVEVPSALESSETTEPLALESAVPNAFEPWPPFVLSWEVSGSSPPRQSSSFWALAWDPCRIIGAPTCHVRLAWGSWQRWALQASADPTFDDRDVLQLALGPSQYMVDDGIIQAIGDGGRTPPIDACDALLVAKHQGQEVRVVGSDQAGRPVLTFSGPDGASARCLGLSGIPVGFTAAGKSWRFTHFELRPPTDEELGIDLVEARVEDLPEPSCRLSPSDSEASVVAWTTENEPELLPPGMRRRNLGEGLVAEEIIEPTPVISVSAGEVRLWVTSESDVLDSRLALENRAQQLGRVARDLLASLDEAADLDPACAER